MMSTEEKYKPPESTTGDTAHLAVSGILSVVPGLSELFQYFVTPPLEKRRAEWMEEVGEALRKLEQDYGVKLDELQENDVFIDTVLHASQIVSRNSQEEKRDALRNAIINAALPNPPDESIQLMFLNWIDTFTVWHLKFLYLFQNPYKCFIENDEPPPLHDYSSINVSTFLTTAYPELRNRQEFYDLVVSELNTRGLLSISDTNTLMINSEAFEKHTTSLGDKFLGFITVLNNEL